MSVLLDMTKFTKTEKRVLELLMDGNIHSVDEILDSCFEDSFVCTVRNLRPHIYNIRAKVSPSGLLLNFVSNSGRRGGGYQLSRRL